jgi:arylsulfatase A-like enzyme
MPDWEPSFLEPLKERGYFVGAFRKVHQGPSFDKRWNFYGGVRDPFEKFFDALPAGRPFFLQFGSTDPHRPYAPGAVRPPHDPAKVNVPPFVPDSPEIRQDLAYYYDEISRFDSECGQILDIIEKRNLASNTLVLFTTDNGMPFPRAKGTLYEAGIRLPMIAKWPSKFQSGGTTSELISHLDLAPTWLEAAGIEKPAKMQGRSFLPLLLGRSYTARTEVFAERNWHDNFDPMRCIRTARYKFIFNATPNQPYRPIADLRDSATWASIQAMAWNGSLSAKHMRMLDPTRPLFELYDLQRDPEELQNLAGSPEHASVLADLQLKLSDWMHDTLDYLPPLYQTRGKADRRRLL